MHKADRGLQMWCKCGVLLRARPPLYMTFFCHSQLHQIHHSVCPCPLATLQACNFWHYSFSPCTTDLFYCNIKTVTSCRPRLSEGYVSTERHKFDPLMRSFVAAVHINYLYMRIGCCRKYIILYQSDTVPERPALSDYDM